jgi:hypothetical protein
MLSSFVLDASSTDDHLVLFLEISGSRSFLEIISTVFFTFSSFHHASLAG